MTIKIIKNLLFWVQKKILISSFLLFMFIKKKRTAKNWVVGLSEIASFLNNTQNAFPNDSISVCFYKAHFYCYKYNYDWSGKGLKSLLQRFFCGPVLLAHLATKYRGFIYLGSVGFLIPNVDGRNFEFSFLKKNGINVVVFFLGSEIRSQKLMLDYSKSNNVDTIVTYQYIVDNTLISEELENERKLLARAADAHADLIFNPSIDQLSYLKCKTHGLPYFYPDNLFSLNHEKWTKQSEPLKILHCPSSPIVKGTPLVRASIKKLEVEGFKFDYVELINVSHEQILDELKSTHIVLNEFYAFVPGMVGIEAMANGCVLVTSADEKVENTLPNGANDAWVVTPYWDIYHKLKTLLESDRTVLSNQAKNGFNWAQKHYSATASARYLRHLIDTI